MKREADSRLPEYFPSEAVALVKGEAARTSFLIGCFVPVVLYAETAVLGHFGPGRTVEAHYKLLTQCLGLNNPSQVVVYRAEKNCRRCHYCPVGEYSRENLPSLL